MTSTGIRFHIRRAVAALWLTASGIQLTVWTTVVLLGQDWHNPWWLWTFVAGGMVTAGVWWATTQEPGARKVSGANR